MSLDVHTESLLMDMILATPGTYLPEAQQWMPLDPLERVERCAIDQITVVTLNVWFAHAYFAARCQATLDLLATYQPDVITLQEVTPAFLTQLLQTPWIQAAYQVSDIAGASIDPYGVLILSRLPVLDWQYTALPSAMGRQLVCARVAHHQTTTLVASVHLESHSYAAPTRAKQLARIFPLLAKEQHTIVSGDFNFGAAWDENQRLDPGYQDIWHQLHPTAPGFTVDTTVNTMRFGHTGAKLQARFDRILLRSEQPGWQAKTVALLGTVPIHATTPNIFPSDHFGLVSQLVWQP